MENRDKQTEYWRWLEYQRIMPGKDWKDAKIVTAGAAVGPVVSKAVIMTDEKIYSWIVMRTGSNSSDSAKKALGWAMENTGLTLKDFNYIVGTGYGKAKDVSEAIRKGVAQAKKNLIKTFGLEPPDSVGMITNQLLYQLSYASI